MHMVRRASRGRCPHQAHNILEQQQVAAPAPLLVLVAGPSSPHSALGLAASQAAATAA
jgi:hypothetical protein